MRPIKTSEITKAVKEICIKSSYQIPEDVKNKIKQAENKETWPMAKDILGKILCNIDIAKNENLPACQDTGMVCVFIEIGQEVHIVGGSLEEAIHEGVRQGYKEGYLRKSVVEDPLRRKNTEDNTPAVIYYELVAGDGFKMTIAPKGAGSENMSQAKMLKPSDGETGIKEFVVEVVKEAGPNPCPPTVVGVGIGGNFDKVALMAKKAAIRPLNEKNPDKYYAELEEKLLEEINALGIGPQGLGGQTTALKINIETFPTHIASLPVAVNINCHVARHVSIEL